MADAYDMIHVTQRELEQLVRQDTRCIREAKERMVGKDGAETHCPGMQDRLVAQTAETGMAVDNLDALPNDNVAEYWEEREDGWERALAIEDEKGDMVDL